MLNQPFLLDADPKLVGDPSSVLRFSGGTDSFCAAMHEAAAGRKPMLVSHSPSGRVAGQQSRLRDALAGSSLGWHVPHYRVEVTKRAVSEKERTQRSRGFLYSSVGAAVAARFGLNDVVVADNGFVSVGLPLNGQTVGAKMSRTTHPRFQYLFNRPCNLLLPTVRVRKAPMDSAAKAEAASRAAWWMSRESSQAIEQAIGRLRKAVQPAIRELDAARFIEASRGRVRLSTHRGYLILKRSNLAGHPLDNVRGLLTRIPAL